MKWQNLKSNKCPQCNKDLSLGEHYNNMTYCKCGFRISDTKFNEITSKQTIGRLDRYKDNQQGLNEL